MLKGQQSNPWRFLVAANAPIVAYLMRQFDEMTTAIRTVRVSITGYLSKRLEIRIEFANNAQEFFVHRV